MSSHNDRKTEGNLRRFNSRHKPKNRGHESDHSSDDGAPGDGLGRFGSFKGFLERKTSHRLPSSGGEPASRRRQRPKVVPAPKPKNRNHESDHSSDDGVPGNGLGRFGSFKNFIERKTSHRKSNSGGEPASHRGHSPRDAPAPFPGATPASYSTPPPAPNVQSSQPWRNEKPNPKHAHRGGPLNSETTKLPGTRGLFIPTYGSPEHYSQRRRLVNPTLPPPTNTRRPRDASEVVVRFFDCENLTYSREFLTSPDAKRLVSAAIGFLGECQLKDAPEAPKSPNPGYRGLSLAGSLGSYHLHFPDCAGVRPLHGEISADWESVKKIYRRDCPGDVLLVGVGLGEPGAHCN
ncbi:hypothetical protein F5B18DRAFT_654607 [Nemania serpens]|nr:hypothetical protein F5B18DRAFT_654607 [Nemania serpens]